MLKKTKLAALTTLSIVVGYCGLQAMDGSDSNPATTITAAAETEKEKEKEIDMKKLSEAFGNFIGKNIQSPGLSFDLEEIIKGIRDGAAGKPSPLTEKEYEEMMATVQEKAFKEMASTNLKKADAFMEKNMKESDVKEIVPGKLQYTTLKEGYGTVVEMTSSPQIQYLGKYQDGTVFGSSEEMGGPITIPLEQTIPGFSKGIVGMKEGEKRRLFVHPDLGYGTTGQLPPNELLIFDIEVVKAHVDQEKGKASKGGMHDGETSDAEEDDAFYLDGEDEDDSEPESDLEKPSSKK